MFKLDEQFYGKIEDPDGFACVKGICGDEMEFYIRVKNNTIEDVKYYTMGCAPTRLCAETAARFARGKSVNEALSLSPSRVIAESVGLPADHSHCSILSSITLFKAIADYMYKNGL